MSIALSPFYFQSFGSSLLSLFWILFQVVAYFLFIYLVFCVFSLSLYLHNIFFCLFIFFFFKLLCLRSPFPRLQVWISSCFWFLPPVGNVSPVFNVGFVLGVNCACILVEGGVFPPLMGMAVWGGNPVCWWFCLCFCLLFGWGILNWLLLALGCARSCIQVEAFVRVLTNWYSLELGVLWQSRVLESALSFWWLRVWSLVREFRFHK